MTISFVLNDDEGDESDDDDDHGDDDDHVDDCRCLFINQSKLPVPSARSRLQGRGVNLGSPSGVRLRYG